MESGEGSLDLIGGEALEGEIVVDAPKPLRLRSSRLRRRGIGGGGGEGRRWRRRRRRRRGGRGEVGVHEEAAEAALVLRRDLELRSGGSRIGGVGFPLRLRPLLLLRLLLRRHC